MTPTRIDLGAQRILHSLLAFQTHRKFSTDPSLHLVKVKIDINDVNWCTV